MSTNIVYFNLRLKVAGMYASLTKSNKKRKNSNQRGKASAKNKSWQESVGPPQICISQCDYRLETTIAPLIYLYYL